VKIGRDLLIQATLQISVYLVLPQSPFRASIVNTPESPCGVDEPLELLNNFLA